jgi:4-hydroxybenzoate polyprenyltransferase
MKKILKLLKPTRWEKRFMTVSGSWFALFVAGLFFAPTWVLHFYVLATLVFGMWAIAAYLFAKN